MKAVKAFKNDPLNPNPPEERGSAQNPDIFFQAREAFNIAYNDMPKIVEEYIDNVNKKIRTNYKLFNYYGAKHAKTVIVAMDSVCETIDETIDYLRANTKDKIGIIKVRLYIPFSKEHFVKAIPTSCKNLVVLDRNKELGSIGEPLYLDVLAAIKGSKFEKISVLNGRYVLGSKNTTPE